MALAKTLDQLRHRPLRAAICIALAVTVGFGVPACTPTVVIPPSGLKNCFEDLPLAEGALNAPAHSYLFHGVKLVSPKVMAKLVHERFPTDPASNYRPPPTGSEVCAFAFTGNFPAGQVAEAPSDASGKAAVVLTTTDLHLLFSFVLAKLPESFSQAFTRP